MITTKTEEWTATEAAALVDLSEKQVGWFLAWKARLRSDPDIMGGATTFMNSRLTVRHIGCMLERGGNPAEILVDYPYLTQQDLEFARLFVRAYPLAVY